MKKSAFTLVELMITVAIFTVVSAALFSFFLQSIKSMDATKNRMELAASINSLTSELSSRAAHANQLVLFEEATNSSMNTRVAQQYLRGDMAVFVYYKFPKPTSDAQHRIDEIYAYMLTDTNPTTRVGKFQKVYIKIEKDNGSFPTIEDLLKDSNYYNSTTSTWKKVTNKSTPWGDISVSVSVIESLAKGLLPEDPANKPGPAPSGKPTVTLTSDARLFYIKGAREIIVSGQFLSSTGAINTFDWRTHSNIFNFTISPRSGTLIP